MSAAQELPWTKHVALAPSTPANPARPPKASRLSMGASIAKLIQAARGDRHVDVQRVADTIARRLDDSGDGAEAQAIRNAVDHGGRATRIGGRDDDMVEWLEPGSADELVLDADCGRHLERLSKELQVAAKFIAAGIDAPTRALFFGPSGTGKTLAVRWLGARLGLPVAMVRLDRVVGGHIGETAANLGKAFASAGREASILFLDELDGMSANRATGAGGSAAGAEMNRATTTLLQQLDLNGPERIVIAATNHPDQLDAALRRRFASEIGFSLPDEAARRTMAARWLAKVDATPTALDAVAALSEGLAGARVRALAMSAARLAIMAGVPVGDEHVRTARASEPVPEAAP